MWTIYTTQRERKRQKEEGPMGTSEMYGEMQPSGLIVSKRSSARAERIQEMQPVQNSQNQWVISPPTTQIAPWIRQTRTEEAEEETANISMNVKW